MIMSQYLVKTKSDIPETLLEVRGLHAYLKQDETNNRILHDISFKVFRNASTAIMGRSGIGKTVLIKAILGLLDMNKWRLEGDIIFYSKTTAENYPSENYPSNNFPPDNESEETYILKDGRYTNSIQELRGKNLFTIFQGADTHLHPSLTIKWQIEELFDAITPDNDKLTLLKERLKAVGIHPEDYRKYPHQFSQGQRQRIMIAMAINHPDLIIADEPTSSLDSDVKTRIITLLKNLKRENRIKSMLLITHDFRVLYNLFEGNDTIIILDQMEKNYNNSGEMDKTTRSTGIYETTKLKDIVSFLKNYNKLHYSINMHHPLLTHINLNHMKRHLNLRKSSNKRIVLEIRNVNQSYRETLFSKKRTILQDINLTVYEGEFLGIVGKSGCGKTTLVKSICRLLPNTKGSIYYYRYFDTYIGTRTNITKEDIDTITKTDLIALQPDGLKPDSEEMRELRKEIQIIFQDSASIFNPRMTIGELLSETLVEIVKMNNTTEIKRIMAESLLKFGICKSEKEIDEIISKYPGELSGGERQRLAILRVFLLEPKLIIADEPFTNQDMLTKEEIIRMIIKLRKYYNTTFLLVSHDNNIIQSLCDRVAVLHNGIIDINDMHNLTSNKTTQGVKDE
ncbi:MAG: ABC transporter ATP-binding protein [Spirochaetales bacterium]|nr:ABC transporter ATP-binding protein [Spirochaetales bacterium]